eukprot:10766319-Karenia_brevis.AAC.1
MKAMCSCSVPDTLRADHRSSVNSATHLLPSFVMRVRRPQPSSVQAVRKIGPSLLLSLPKFGSLADISSEDLRALR